MNHGGHVIADCAHRYVRIIEKFHSVLLVGLRAHQQVPYGDLSWSLLQMLDDGIIFWLHSPIEFVHFFFAYRPFGLILLFSSESNLVRSVTPSRLGHALSSISFNNKLRLDESF